MEPRISGKRRVLSVLLGQILAGISFGAFPCAAQEPPAAVAPLKDQSILTEKSNAEPRVEMAAASTSNERLFLALPSFLTMEKSSKVLRPLTTGEKFNVVARGSFDYAQIPWTAMLAGINQAQNNEAGYGQGMTGYGKRLGSAFADNTIESFMVGAVFPSLLKEDPRYYRMGAGGLRRRTAYAVSHVFVTRTDSGRKRFNYSEILGTAVAAAICTYSYHPIGDRNVSGAASVWGRQVAFFTLNTFVREFWPEIRRNLPHRR